MHNREVETMKIGLFDSGVGGLTVLKTLKETFPSNEYVYYGDTLNLPYGTKSKEELFILACKNIDFLISRGAEIIIIACGTVSSNCYNELKEKYDIPIINIIDPTIEYLIGTAHQSIGVFGTNATINSNVFTSRIKNKNVIQVACEKFVPYIETNNTKTGEFEEIVNSYVQKLGKVDCIILACTHYPIIQSIIAKAAAGVELIDMSKCITKFITDNTGNGSVNLYFSKLDINVKDNAMNILGFECNIMGID